MPDIKLDFNVDDWSLSEQMDFEDVAKVTCDQAQLMLAKAGTGKNPTPAEQEAARDALFAIPSRVRVGFLYIAARREDPSITFEQVAQQFTGDEFWKAMAAFSEQAPLEVEPEPTTKKSSAPSATTSTTPRRKSGT